MDKGDRALWFGCALFFGGAFSMVANPGVGLVLMLSGVVSLAYAFTHADEIVRV